jgi:hypothetical protein
MPEKKASGSQMNEQMLCQKLSRVLSLLMNASTLSTHVARGGWGRRGRATSTGWPLVTGGSAGAGCTFSIAEPFILLNTPGKSFRILAGRAT